jgi:predicted small lipoprotein YifL
MGAITKAGVSMAVLFALAGCGSKTPSCSDPATIDLVKKIYQQSFDKERSSASEERQKRIQYTAKDTTISLDSITTASADDAVGKKTCEAQLVVTVPDDAVPQLADMKTILQATYEPQGVSMSGNAIKGRVTYAAQRTEDKGELLVSLIGHLPILSYFHDVALFRVRDKGVPATPDTAARPSASKVNWSSFLGQSASVVLSDAVVSSQFKALLGDKYTVFQTNMEVAGELHAEDGNLIIGSGNAPHDGGTNEAIFAVNTATGKSYAVLFTDGKTFNAFGVASMRELPAPLLQWFQDKGGKL